MSALISSLVAEARAEEARKAGQDAQGRSLRPRRALVPVQLLGGSMPEHQRRAPARRTGR